MTKKNGLTIEDAVAGSEDDADDRNKEFGATEAEMLASVTEEAEEAASKAEAAKAAKTAEADARAVTVEPVQELSGEVQAPAWAGAAAHADNARKTQRAAAAAERKRVEALSPSKSKPWLPGGSYRPNRFKLKATHQGWHHRWVRPSDVERRASEGYRFARPSDYGGGKANGRIDQAAKGLDSLIRSGTLILMECQETHKRDRDAYFRGVNQEQVSTPEDELIAQGAYVKPGQHGRFGQGRFRPDLIED
jgi:hypothetical protein